MSRPLRLVCLVLVVAAVALLAAWLLRRPLGEAVVARWFAARGIPADYRITALSTDAVSLADVALGPGGAPDFKSDRIDVRLSWSPFAPRVDHVTLVRPVIRAVLGRGGLSLGSLDPLLPAPGAPAAPLPDIELDLVDARATLATHAGSLTLTGSGAGRLRGGFAGRFRLGDTRLAAAGCAGRIPGATLAVSTTRDAVRVVGDGTAGQLACAGGVAVARIGWHADLSLPPKLDRYAVRLSARTGPARAGGFAADTLDAVADGAAATLAGPVAGAFTLTVLAASGPSSGAGRVAARGDYRFDPASSAASANARISAERARIALPLRALHATGARLSGTLAQPLADRLAARLGAAASAFDASGSVMLNRRAGGTTGSLTGVTLTAATGARFVQTGRITLVGTDLGMDGAITVAGGGLPTAAFISTGRWQRGIATGNGTLTVSRWTVPGAAVEAARLNLVAVPAGVAVTGGARVSGLLGGGISASGLDLPIDARIGANGSFAYGERCLPVAWFGLARGDSRLGRARITVCPAGRPMLSVVGDRLQGGAAIAGVTLNGRVGAAAFGLTSSPLRLALSGSRSRPSLGLSPVSLAGRLGDRRGRATIDGIFDIAGGSGHGHLQGAALDDPASPVLVDEGAAQWRLAGTRVDLEGATARVVDRAAPARFQPLRVAGGTAVLANGSLGAHGSVQVAATTAELGRFDVRHDLGSGRGTARLDTGTLVFGPALQPYEITENLRGIVANVRGPISGSGQVDWTPAGITSRGTVRIDNLALATESLGPVEGIAGTIAFDDLLALTTPPGQTLRIARINPGVALDDGVAVFRMLGPDAAAIDSIRWPYAGGTLALAPVTIRAGDLRRAFLLTVDGIDAQQFLQRFEIKNLNVTGRFDGRLPLVFADGRGRIAGGRLVARAGGGLVQYVGEIGSEQVGAAARLAFDALRRLRYHDLTLDLDGDLDGELVTQVHFAGSNEAAATLAGGPLPVKVTGLPFRFGITVRAPFRALLGTAASFSDVRPLLHGAPPPDQPATVQPK